jgi:signal transduction histidine kinase
VTSVRAVLDALAADPSPQLAARFLPRAILETERLTRLLDDLTVDVKPPVLRRIPLHELVVRATGVLQPLLERRGVRVVLDLPQVVVLADEDKLLQVLVNLLENAAVHGPPAEEVELAGWVQGAWLRLEVRDRGVPLDPVTVDVLFEPHSRGRGNAKGTGLGLYIVRSIASRWGGESWGGSRTDGAASGNAFGVSVPLAP